MAQVSGNRRTKLEEPAPYALVGNIQTSLRKEILHIPIAQSEPGIEPNGASNDFRWKAVTFEGDGVHPKRLHRNHQIEIRALNVTMPSRQLGEVFLPVARKPYIPDDPSTLFDFELGDEHRLRDPAGHRVRSRPNEEIATNCQRDAASNLNRSSAISDGYFRFHLAPTR